MRRPASPWSASESSPGRCSSRRRAGTSSAGWTGARPAADGGMRVDLATATASPPPWFCARAPRRRCRSTADGRRLWPGSRQAYCPSSPGVPRRCARARRAARRRATPTTRRWPCGTSTTSTAATTCAATARRQRERVPRLAARALRRRSTRSTRRGAPRSGASATPTGTRSLPPRGHPERSPTRPSSWTSARFSSDELLRRLYRAEREVLHGSRRACPVTTNFMAGLINAARLLGVGARAGRRLHRPLPDRRGRGRLRRPRARGRPHPRRWPAAAVAADGALHQRRELAAAQRREAPRQMRRNSLSHVARGADGRDVLPVAGVPRRRREVPLGDGAARRHRQPRSGARW